MIMILIVTILFTTSKERFAIKFLSSILSVEEEGWKGSWFFDRELYKEPST